MDQRTPDCGQEVMGLRGCTYCTVLSPRPSSLSSPLVQFLDERTSHERITSVPYEPYHEDTPHSSRRTFGDSPNQRVRFQHPQATHRPPAPHYTPAPHHDRSPRHRPPTMRHIPTATHHRHHPAPHWQYPTTRFHHPVPAPQVVAAAKPPAPRPMNIFNGSSWWSGNNYGINWRSTWNPLTEFSRAGVALPYNYSTSLFARAPQRS